MQKCDVKGIMLAFLRYRPSYSTLKMMRGMEEGKPKPKQAKQPTNQKKRNQTNKLTIERHHCDLFVFPFF